MMLLAIAAVIAGLALLALSACAGSGPAHPFLAAERVQPLDGPVTLAGPGAETELDCRLAMQRAVRGFAAAVSSPESHCSARRRTQASASTARARRVIARNERADQCPVAVRCRLPRRNLERSDAETVTGHFGNQTVILELN